MRADRAKRKSRVKGFDLNDLKLNNENLKPGDFWLLAVVVALVIFGVIMVFSASYYVTINEGKGPYQYLIKDLLFAIMGFGLMMVTFIMPYHYWKKLTPVIFGITVVLLIFVLIPIDGINDPVNGAYRWIKLGPVSIMPGEIAKFVSILMVAKILGDNPKKIHSLKEGILPILGVCVLFGGLIMKQPNMSTAATMCMIVGIMMFVAGLKWRWLISVVIAAGIGGVALLFQGGGYRMGRITSFLDPFEHAMNEGFQVVQSLMALGSGGLFGVGLGKSVQKNLYLPEPQNDFILAIIGEELGFVGVMFLIGAYVFLIWRGVHIALNAPDQYGLMLASGIVIMISLQVVLNIAVVTSSMPPTGVILPFISYGGNALWIFMASAGILLNISRHTVEVK